MNLPNKITLTRIFMIPVFILFFYLEIAGFWPYNYLVAAVVFALAAFTDALDGHIARSRGLVTNLGKFLDPIADKVLVSTALILLLTRPHAFVAPETVGFGSAAVWTIVCGICVAVILARELIVSGFRMIAAGRNLVLAADKLGKFKTVFQDVAVFVLLLAMAFYTPLGPTKVAVAFSFIGLVCFFTCTVLTVLSGVNYIVKNRHVLKEEEKEEQP